VAITQTGETGAIAAIKNPQSLRQCGFLSTGGDRWNHHQNRHTFKLPLNSLGKSVEWVLD
jgi:hypothetical protein